MRKTLLRLGMLCLMALCSFVAKAEFTDFTIDLTQNPVGDLPEGVTQISYPQNGVSFNGAQHGWCWYAIEFAVDGPVDITLGGCQYTNEGYEGYLEVDGTKVADIKNKTAACWDADKVNNVGTYSYTGGAATLRLYCGQYCPFVEVKKAAPAPAEVEFRNFELVLNDQSTLLAADEKEQGKVFDFGIKVAEDGTVSRVAKDDPEASATITGKYWNDHGSCNVVLTVPVGGPVKVTYGACTYGNHTASILPKNGTPLAVETQAACWKDDHGKVTSVVYAGGADVLTINGTGYLPYIAVESTTVTPSDDPDDDDPEGDVVWKEKKLYQTNFQDWAKVAASKSVTKVEKKMTNDSVLIFSLYNTACEPAGTNSKFTGDACTTGYLMTQKDKENHAYVETSPIANLTRIELVQAATGGTRGVTVFVKGDGDEDWVALHNKSIDTGNGETLSLDVNRTNCQIRFSAFNYEQNAYILSLKLFGKVATAKRTFADFKVDFRTNPYTVTLPAGGQLPEGVTIEGGEFHDAQHGYTKNTLVTVPVDGPVRFTLGGCQYGNQVQVKSLVSKEVLATIDVKAAGCDNGFGTYTKSVSWLYNVEAADTLQFDLGAYCPYFFAEEADFVPEVTVTYFALDGSRLGEEVVLGNSELVYKYSVADLNVPSGQAFRGWFNSKAVEGTKVAEGYVISEDLKLFAKATEIETVQEGSILMYDMTKNYWYVEDHELIDITNGKYYNNHGWTIGDGGTISVKVAGKAYMTYSLCQYGNAATATLTDLEGNVIGTIDLPVASDGATKTITYDGPATTLTLTFAGGAYVHGVTVYNVNTFVEYSEATGYYMIPAGDASSFLLALTAANGDGNCKIYLPNGTYDLGNSVLTSVSGKNISIVGESMEGTIIKNTALKEGIGETATLLNNSDGLYLQDLTLQNAYDYYGKGGDGRAVCLQDKGANTICKNVRMLSYQDTYYSNKASNFYWEDSEIHGLVDYICGDGNVVYNRVTFVNESRSKTGNTGDVTMAAPYNTATTSARYNWGYVFLDCTIETLSATFNLGRSWGGESKAAYINTTINQPSKLVDKRWNLTGMNVAAAAFKEYNTMDKSGNRISPSSKSLTFTHSSGNKTYETIMTDEEAAQFTVANIYGDWNPDQICAQVDTVSEKATAYLIGSGADYNIVTSLEGITEPTVMRAANSRGGFGPAFTYDPAANSIQQLKSDAESATNIYNVSGQKTSAVKGLLIMEGKVVFVK